MSSTPCPLNLDILVSYKTIYTAVYDSGSSLVGAFEIMISFGSKCYIKLDGGQSQFRYLAELFLRAVYI